MTLGRVGIPMKMSVVPALVAQAIFQLIEKRCKPIDFGVIPARCRIERGREHARGTGVGDHVVDSPAHAVELCPRFLKVALTRLCVSSGSACHGNHGGPSHVLKAIGKTDEESLASIRLTFNHTLNQNQADYCIDCIKKNVAALRKIKND